jgi:hypothetical protein
MRPFVLLSTPLWAVTYQPSAICHLLSASGLHVRIEKLQRPLHEIGVIVTIKRVIRAGVLVELHHLTQ